MTWYRTTKFSPAACALADRHYSRQSVGAPQFMPPGKTLILVTPLGDAVWGVVENLDPIGATRFRCSIFRNESAARSSDMIVEATEITYRYWRRKWGGASVPLTTEIDPARVRHKRDPGRCFLRAGWHRDWWCCRRRPRQWREVPPLRRCGWRCRPVRMGRIPGAPGGSAQIVAAQGGPWLHLLRSTSAPLPLCSVVWRRK